MKIAVTGGTGFIGNYVVQSLLNDGHDVLVTGYKSIEGESYPWFTKVQFFELDIENIENDLVLKQIASCDKLIHLIWTGLPNYNDLFHFEQNLIPQYFFLKRLVDLGMNDIAITGTCFEYGMRQGGLSTDMTTEPKNPYALAKDTLRKFLTLMQTKMDFKLKWIRLFYMYGDGQSKHSILSQLDRALDAEDKIFNMSGGEQLRDYLPVEQVAKRIIEISCEEEESGVFNCASNVPISIRTLVENHLAKKNKKIELNLGHYPYPEFEPMAFWGKEIGDE